MKKAKIAQNARKIVKLAEKTHVLIAMSRIIGWIINAFLVVPRPILKIKEIVRSALNHVKAAKIKNILVA